MPSLVLSAILLATLPVIEGSLFDSLRYYEVLDHVNAFSRSRRSVGDLEDGSTKEFSFKAFNRSITCHLRHRTEIFAPGFKVSLVHSDGQEEAIALQEGNFFEGKVVGFENSEVHGYFEDDLFTGTIDLKEELYIIEPEWRHVHDHNSVPKNRMIIYRGSDIRFDKEGARGTFCGSVHPEDETSSNSEDIDVPAEGSHTHHKRSIPTWNTCSLIAVADYKFYRGMGRSDVYTTASYMAGVVERVDALYKSTVWNSEGQTGLGFEIKSMRIHDSPTLVSGGGVHYNMEKTDWDPLGLLKAFSRDLTFQDYCLAHLFTYQSFVNNVLGLAYIASHTLGSVGGLCSGAQAVDGVQSSLNTGLSTSRNEQGSTILTNMADLVTAHEFGHNWGSEHDPSSGGCSPSSIIGDGKYLMYPYSVSGTNANNYLFSSCSKALMDRVLKSKGPTCLKERTVQQTCGNGIIDNDEQCDAGYLGKFGLDPCCSSSCHLIGDAVCSPVNHECCVNCHTANIGYVCVTESNISCHEGSYCIGDGFTCPPAANKPQGTPCLDGGLCNNGVCQPFCEARGSISCVCNEVGSSCFRCCRNESSGPCMPFDSINTLPDGRPCVQGYCVKGSCKRTVQNTIERLFSIIDNLTIDGVIQFFQDNIIGAILILSLIVWVPVCIALRIHDYRRQKSFEEDMYREIKRDRLLIYDEDGRLKKKPVASENTNGFLHMNPSDLNSTFSSGD